MLLQKTKLLELEIFKAKYKFDVYSKFMLIIIFGYINI